MAKMAANVVLDAALEYIQNYCDFQWACSAEPASYAECLDTGGGYGLVKAAMVSGDFTIADDAASGGGRKLTLDLMADETILASGNAEYVVLVDSSESKILYITTCATLALNVGQLMDFSSWKIQIKDPV